MSRRSWLTRQLGTFQRIGEAAFTSSRQFGPVQLAAAEAPVGVEGLAMGKSMRDGQGFLHDPFLLYPKHLADPNVLLFGGQGTINVPCWSPDSKKIAFVSYQLIPAQ